MTHQSIEEIVRQFIIDRFLPGSNAERVMPETLLLSSGLLDSLRVLELIAFLEERFNILLEAHDVNRENLDSLAAIAQLVRTRGADAS